MRRPIAQDAYCLSVYAVSTFHPIRHERKTETTEHGFRSHGRSVVCGRYVLPLLYGAARLGERIAAVALQGIDTPKMSKTDLLFNDLKERLRELTSDLQALETLLAVDVASSLNKIRFITEKVLHGLCGEHGISWGRAEPTLERMIGPLVSAGIIPRNVSIFVRTIQTNTSPGSHYQESSLSRAHVEIAQSALVEFLRWHYAEHHRESESCSRPPIEKEQVGKRDAAVVDSTASAVTGHSCGPSIPTASPQSASETVRSPTSVAALGQPLETITNSIGMKLVRLPAGEFLMGSPDSDAEALPQEKPQHRVHITGRFYFGMYPVTVGQFRQFAEESGYETEGQRAGDAAKWNDWFGCKSDDHPVVLVSWYDAVEFCQWLSGTEGGTYRLPSEAEWEYACRAGTETKYNFGDDAGRLSEYAWFKGNSQGSPQPVGQKTPNAWGLYDMDGNVWEWCADWHDTDYYRHSPPEDPTGPSQAADRVIRGGSWRLSARGCRAAIRYGIEPQGRYVHLGFRVAAVPFSS